MLQAEICIGIDVSKDWHYIAIIDEEKKCTTFKIENCIEGYQKLESTIRTISRQGLLFRIGMEATGHYHFNLERFIRDHLPGIDTRVTVIHPLRSKRFMDVRGVKSQTDRVDAKNIADYISTFKPEPTAEKTPAFRALRHLNNLRNALVKQKTELVNQLHAVLQEIFPEFEKVIKADLKSSTLAWEILEKYPLPEDIAHAGKSALIKVKIGRECLDEKTVSELKKAASKTIGVPGVWGSQIRVMVGNIRLLSKQIDDLELGMEKAIGPMDIPTSWKTIPNISVLTMATILAYGDPRSFKSTRQFLAYIGLTPKYKLSGQAGARHSKSGSITKAGPPMIRRNLYMCVLSALANEKNPILVNFYKKLRDKGKPGKVALVACMAKLARIIWGVFKSGKPFETDYESKRSAISPKEPAIQSVNAPKEKASESPKKVTSAPCAGSSTEAESNNKKTEKKKQGGEGCGKCGKLKKMLDFQP